MYERAPRTARRYQDGTPQVVDVALVRRGDRLLVAAGELVPTDGVVERDAAWSTRAWRSTCWPRMPPGYCAACAGPASNEWSC
ncbi:P-type ATPase [Sphaerisporangium aureirubrum]|uniref:P-type ATPase A domain-containing protein n=1 Tax=Sphaerisporangium aureirubrum TaxID=1544736 RepID=A0ABW1NSK9_9ACTN